jgi:hypothetical protein
MAGRHCGFENFRKLVRFIQAKYLQLSCWQNIGCSLAGKRSKIFLDCPVECVKFAILLNSLIFLVKKYLQFCKQLLNILLVV